VQLISTIFKNVWKLLNPENEYETVYLSAVKLTRAQMCTRILLYHTYPSEKIKIILEMQMKFRKMDKAYQLLQIFLNVFTDTL